MKSCCKWQFKKSHTIYENAYNHNINRVVYREAHGKECEIFKGVFGADFGFFH